MNLQLVIVISITFSLSLLVHASIGSSQPLLVTIYYESLCSDAIQFFREQFEPNWRRFGDAVQWRMVPYGKAEHVKDRNGIWQFTCQHDAPECKSNGVQASLLSIEPDPTIVLDFISCYMQGKDKETLGYKCGKKFNVDYKYLEMYSDTPRGRELLAVLGDETHNAKPKITFIPFIAFDNHHNFKDSEEARKNLFQAISKRIQGSHT